MAQNDPALTQDPFQEAEQNSLPAAQTPFQRLNAGSGIPMIDEALKRDVLQKQAQANLYHKNAADINGLLFHLADPEARKSYLNPQTGQPYSDDDIQQLQSQLEHATGQYEKLVGVDKESKGALQKARTIIDFIHGKRRAAMTPPPSPQYGSTITEQGVIPTPTSGTNVGEAGVSPGTPQLTPPPLSPRQEASRASMQLPFATHPAKVGQAITDEQQRLQADMKMRENIARNVLKMDPDSREFRQYVAVGTFPPLSKFQKTNMVDPDTGMPAIFDPAGAGFIDTEGHEVAKPVPYEKGTVIAYQGPKGEPLFGVERYQKLFDQNGNQLPSGTRKFYPSMAEQDRWNIVYKQVPQPDGRIALVPVLQRSGRTSPQGEPQPGESGPLSITPQGAGVTPSSQAAPVPSNNATPPKPKATPRVDPSAAMGLPKGSIIAGAKVPPGVSKAYDAYNGSVTRYKVMQEALPKALKGDQQAMINLLYNHIGMTTGLQKGGRITQPIIDEAQNSAPWMVTILKRIGVGNEFEMSPELLRGVVIDPQTMHNMVGLAEDRVNNEYSAWQREIAGAKTGYGMSTPPPPSSPDIGSAAKPGGKPSTFKPF